MHCVYHVMIINLHNINFFLLLTHKFCTASLPSLWVSSKINYRANEGTALIIILTLTGKSSVSRAPLNKLAFPPQRNQSESVTLAIAKSKNKNSHRLCCVSFHRLFLPKFFPPLIFCWTYNSIINIFILKWTLAVM